MSDATLGLTGPDRPALRQRLRQVADGLLPLLLALIAAGVILLLFGRDPLAYYHDVLKRGLFSWMGLQEVLTRMAPLLLVGAGLIVCFRSGIWNLGSDGQFLLAAMLTAHFAVPVSGALPPLLALPLLFCLAFLVGAGWALLPAWLKARYGTNEIITTLMMNLLGLSFAAFLIKGPFNDPGSTAPQTVTLPVDERLPRLFDSGVSSGLLVALLVILLVHWVLTRTAAGLRFRVVGANRRAALHAGLPVGRLMLLTFAIGGGLAGLGGAVEILGVSGNVRAEWNPGYGFAMLPLVFLARFNGIATIGFTFVYALLSIGGQTASRKADLPQDFLLVLIALVLIFMGLTEWLRRRRGVNAS